MSCVNFSSPLIASLRRGDDDAALQSPLPTDEEFLRRRRTPVAERPLAGKLFFGSNPTAAVAAAPSHRPSPLGLDLLQQQQPQHAPIHATSSFTPPPPRSSSSGIARTTTGTNFKARLAAQQQQQQHQHALSGGNSSVAPSSTVLQQSHGSTQVKWMNNNNNNVSAPSPLSYSPTSIDNKKKFGGVVPPPMMTLEDELLNLKLQAQEEEERHEEEEEEEEDEDKGEKIILQSSSLAQNDRDAEMSTPVKEAPVIERTTATPSVTTRSTMQTTMMTPSLMSTGLFFSGGRMKIVDNNSSAPGVGWSPSISCRSAAGRRKKAVGAGALSLVTPSTSTVIDTTPIGVVSGGGGGVNVQEPRSVSPENQGDQKEEEEEQEEEVHDHERSQEGIEDARSLQRRLRTEYFDAFGGSGGVDTNWRSAVECGQEGMKHVDSAKRKPELTMSKEDALKTLTSLRNDANGQLSSTPHSSSSPRRTDEKYSKSVIAAFSAAAPTAPALSQQREKEEQQRATTPERRRRTAVVVAGQASKEVEERLERLKMLRERATTLVSMQE